MPRKPVYLKPDPAPEDEETVCSFCGVRVETLPQKRIHTDWHRAVGIVPINAVSMPDSL